MTVHQFPIIKILQTIVDSHKSVILPQKQTKWKESYIPY